MGYRNMDERGTPSEWRKYEGFDLAAQVGVYEYPEVHTTTRHYTIYISAFGVRKGQELSDQQINDKGSWSMTGLFKMMKRPSPMTLVWHPPGGQELLFASIKRRKLRIEFTFVQYRGKYPPLIKSLFAMDNVRITNIIPEIVNGNGGKIKNERINAVFSNLELNP